MSRHLELLPRSAKVRRFRLWFNSTPNAAPPIQAGQKGAATSSPWQPRCHQNASASAEDTIISVRGRQSTSLSWLVAVTKWLSIEYEIVTPLTDTISQSPYLRPDGAAAIGNAWLTCSQRGKRRHQRSHRCSCFHHTFVVAQKRRLDTTELGPAGQAERETSRPSH